MTITPERLSIWWSFIRSSPITNMFYPLLLLLHNPSFVHIYFLLCYILVFLSNGIEKEIFNNIYNLFGTDSLPIIGFGTRPKGASNCGSYLVFPNKPATSYGMPSGHSELAWFISIYIILDLLYGTRNTSNIIILVNSSILIIYAFINSYARVVIEKCHTTGQVCVGALLGIVKAVIFHFIQRLFI